MDTSTVIWLCIGSFGIGVILAAWFSHYMFESGYDEWPS